jgi:hypothetical protein
MATEIHNNSTSKFSKSSQVQSRPNALKVSPFGRLSNGVIRLIAWYLPPASKLAFRHSCLHIYSITATQRLNSVRGTGLIARRTPPWEVLELEYPNHVECYRCRALHPTDKIHEHAYFNPRPKRDTSRQHNFFSPKCDKTNREVRAEMYIHPNFCFTVFRMVMKQYRQGKDCEKLLNLLAYRSGVVMEGAQIKQVIATPKIVGERLLVRLQIASLVQPGGASQTYLITGNLLKCPHTDRWSRDNRILTEALYQRFETLDTNTVSEDRQEHVMSCRCPLCPTEFHFGLQQFKGQGVVLFSTKWQDLGTGLSPLKADLPPIVGRHKSIPVARSGEPPDYESPRHRFEGLAPGEGFRAVSALEEEEREELFRKNNSRRAKFMRINDSWCWSIHGFGQPYPHIYAPRSKLRDEQRTLWLYGHT